MAKTGEPEERGTTAPSEPAEASDTPTPPAPEANAGPEPSADTTSTEPADDATTPTEPTDDAEPTGDATTSTEAPNDATTADDAPAEDDPAGRAEDGADPAEDDTDEVTPEQDAEDSPPKPEWPPTAASTSGNVVTTQARPATLDDLGPRPAPESAPAARPTAVTAPAQPTSPDAEPAAPAEPPAAVGRLATALSQLRATIGGTTYPLVMPSADEARRVGSALVSQLDDYLLPRLARLDAPLLVVVGGSTGAGKSTLVNSLVRAPVSTAGVLRPTTRSPVLVSHPSDASWFRKGELLPGLTRTAESSSDPQTLQLVSAPALGPGLAFLDAPDIDSVVDRNRQLAAQLLAAADLWLFVTTAARYADAVPWELLKTARLRGTVIALVLDRVPEEAAGEISTHLAEMLTEHDMGAAPLFVLPETTLDRQGLLSEDVTRQLHDWFAQLAADANARSTVVRQTLDGALAALGPAVEGLAAAADEQAVAAKALDERVTLAYRNARRTMEEGLQDGRLLRGEVLARWQEFIGTGEFLRTLESRIGQLRDRLVAAVTGRPAPGRNLQAALESQLVTLLRGVASDAAENAYSAWQAHPAGFELLEPALQKPSPDLPQRAERVVRDWQQWVLELVRTEAADKRVVARGAAYAVNGIGLAVMIAVFTSTAFIPTGAEVAVGAGTTVAAQKVLEAIFGDQAIRTLAARAREELVSRVNVLLDAEAARYTDRTAAVGLELEPGATLRQAAADVESARKELALTGTPT
ncbi:dynamin family protein [Actinoplanes sp. NPDC049548]|uniref:dynamin family protein n=1 Tax=Actinoplanes sp. NPDC049548 TaxID=3155152 RepID=UPI0034299D06